MITNNIIINKEETQKLKEIQLKMLKEFINICNKLDLKYYVIGGTALGTIRHNGFIPWDDDIDVGMPRHDYEKFILMGQSLLSQGYFIQTHISDPLYPNNFAKIRDSSTTFIEQVVKDIDMHHGVYLDVFPLDGVAPSKLKKLFFKLKNKLYSSKIREAFDLSIFNLKLSIKNKVVKRFTTIIMWPFSIKEVVAIREKLYKKYDYDSCDLIANYGGAWGEKEIMPKSVFGQGTVKLFENIEVIVPENYDAYLTCLYGNYMELPPVEQRVSHHYCSVIDLNTAYTYYIK